VEKTSKKRFRRKIFLTLVFLFTFFVMFGMVSVVRVFAQEQAPATAVEMTAERASVARFGLIAAGIAIANVGAAAMGAIGERPEIASQALIFIALAEGLVVFGFITALMILGRI
jgi:V/A-type H+-transporting ATPase subunit K